MILTYETDLGLNRVKVNHRVKYLGQRSFRWQLSCEHTHAHAHTHTHTSDRLQQPDHKEVGNERHHRKSWRSTQFVCFTRNYAAAWMLRSPPFVDSRLIYGSTCLRHFSERLQYDCVTHYAAVVWTFTSFIAANRLVYYRGSSTVVSRLASAKQIELPRSVRLRHRELESENGIGVNKQQRQQTTRD